MRYGGNTKREGGKLGERKRHGVGVGFSASPSFPFIVFVFHGCYTNNILYTTLEE